MWDSISHYPYATSSLGINYLILYSIPALLLALQIIRNNKLLWTLIFSLVTTYIGVALYMVVSDAIERSGSHIKAINWELQDILKLLLAFGIMFIIDWILFKIKPRRLI
jgi:hypothetical protein